MLYAVHSSACLLSPPDLAFSSSDLSDQAAVGHLPTVGHGTASAASWSDGLATQVVQWMAGRRAVCHSLPRARLDPVWRLRLHGYSRSTKCEMLELYYNKGGCAEAVLEHALIENVTLDGSKLRSLG